MEELAIRQETGLLNFEEYAMSVEGVVRQIMLIQEVQKKVMKQGEHFGTIPGCGDKPTLLKPGAEKLGFVFRLAPEFDVVPVDWSGGHREYQVKCRLRHIPTGTMVGEGVGTCTTMEGKYRFRWDNTGKPVPQTYWASKDKDLLGGPFNTTRKIDGKWYIFQRVEHDNPADYYNTCEKMAKKRAHVDAILTATAASDIFTQDIEDMPEVMGNNATTQQTATQRETKKPVQQPQEKKTDATPTQGEGSARDKLINEAGQYCNGVNAMVNDLIKECSSFMKDGELKFFELADVTATKQDGRPKISDAWIGSTLGKVRKMMEEQE